MVQATTHAEAMARLEGLGDFVQRLMAQWKVPGAAVGIVKDGQVLYQEGFGKRDMHGQLPVTAQTLFAIGSCTKAFTALGLAILVDEGKLDWDTPVRTYFPAFALHDPVAGERMTPRDLLTHRSGLPRHDFLWYGSPFTREELIARLRYLEPSKDFRTIYQYQNLMFMTAGYLAGLVAGQTWEEFTRARILDPLGMRGSNFSVAASQQAPDFALPHREDEETGEMTVIPFRSLDAIAPAGAINSSVEEMAHWLVLQLQKGTYGERRIVSEAQHAQTHTPQMVVPAPEKYPEFLPLASYCLGWGIQPYRGHRLVQHGGGIDGFTSIVALLPDHNIGVVALNNLPTALPSLIAYNVFDRLLGLDEVPWHERFLKERDEGRAAVKKGKEQAREGRVPDTHPSHPLDAYAGEYAHPAYGTFIVEREGDGLKAAFNTLAGTLQHYHYDIFEMKWTIVLDLEVKVSFQTNVKGDIDALSAPLEPAVKDVVFTRVPSRTMADPAFLAKFAGDYEVPGAVLAVALRPDGGALIATVPGQPDYELVPYKGTEFTLKGLTGFSIAFKLDETGAVTEAVLSQPWGAVTARKK